MKKIRFLVILLSAIILLCSFDNKDEKIVVDSDLTFDQAITGSSAPASIIKDLELVRVFYYSFDGRLHLGQIVVHKELSKDVKDIFEIIKKNKFPVAKVVPIVKYGWQDDSSMVDNNTSSFNYRTVAGTTRLSNHARGRAIDLNPYTNPAVYADGKISPQGAHYQKSKPGTLTDTCSIVKEFKARGWRWGGEFSSFKDWQHFDK